MHTAAIELTLVVATLLVALIYNGLVRARLRVREAWSGVDVQLKRRADLVRNLVQAVQQYAQHERQLFEEVAAARTELQGQTAPASAAEPARSLSQGLACLLAVAEAYPQLRASEQFLSLQERLFDAEEKLAYARHFYNSNVLAYNARLRSFPELLVATCFGFRAADFFEIEEPQGSPVAAGTSTA